MVKLRTSLLVLAQAYWLKDLVPVAMQAAKPLNNVTLNAGLPGYTWLIITGLIIAVSISLLKIAGKRRSI